MSFPPDYSVEIARRFRRLKLLNSNQEAQIAAMAFYKDNPIQWVKDWCVTFDPRRKEMRILPFVLFKRQEEFLQFLWECFKDRENGLVEKSRDMGASWLCCAFSIWLWIFHPGTAVGWGSRKEEYVDKKEDPKAIFPKLIMLLRNLPKWMLPKGYNERGFCTYMKIANMENNSTITGEAGDNIGRGGRTSLYIKDESAWYERPDLIEAALGDNTDVQIDISSVNGTANVFYKRRMAGAEWEPDKTMPKGFTRIFIMDWRDHPLKTQEWYDLRRARNEREGLLHVFAQEVDRDYASAVDRLLISPQWVKAAIDAHITLNFPVIGVVAAGQDVADGGNDKNALVIRHGVVCQLAEDWGGEAGEAAKRTIPECIKYTATELYYDSIGVGAGFKTGINNIMDSKGFPENLKVYPWDAGAGVLNPKNNLIPGDRQSPTNENFFRNLKAQAWWSIRTAFYKTYRAVHHGDKYDPSELISIPANMPNRHKLEMELSQPQYNYTGDGLVLVDKKPEGSSSPNLADAFVICYYPVRKLSILDVL